MRVDSDNFTGVGAVFALILAHARADFASIDHSTASWQTAAKFLQGGTCEHVLCEGCDPGMTMAAECKEPLIEYISVAFGGPKAAVCSSCGHWMAFHQVATYDWTEHRDLIINSLGLDVEGIVGLIRNGR